MYTGPPSGMADELCLGWKELPTREQHLLVRIQGSSTSAL